MRPYRKQNRPRQPAPQPVTRAVTNASSPPPVEVHRYSHPIRTSRTTPQTPAGDLLAEVRDALVRQSEKLDEVLRRLDGDNLDTH